LTYNQIIYYNLVNPKCEIRNPGFNFQFSITPEAIPSGCYGAGNFSPYGRPPEGRQSMIQCFNFQLIIEKLSPCGRCPEGAKID